MKQIGKTLYGKDSKGDLRIWEVFSNDDQVIVKHGKIGGKIQSKVTVAVGKNTGKANATTDSEQATKEAEAKYTKQLKSGYFETKEEALDHEEFTPMKAHNFNDYENRVVYPCYLQPKLNGLRCLTNDKKEMLSKAGEPYNYPEDWGKSISLLTTPLDGEVFSGYQKDGGLSLQKINSAWKKHNENTPKLKYYIYDIPIKNVQWIDRLALLGDLKVKLLDADKIVFVEGRWCNTKEEADQYYLEKLEEGAEGVVYRNADGLYEYGYRSYSLIKRKPRQDAEALVISASKDQNGCALLSCRLENGVEFECQMRVDSHPTINYRSYENGLTLINKFIKFEYEELSDDGVPTKPVGVGLRELDKNWVVQE